MDTNGDGIGDLRGITARLDHLQWLGVDGDLARPDHRVAQQGLGLRRRRLLRRRSRARHARRRRGADRRGVEARHPRHPRPRPQPHERPASVVRRRQLVARRDVPRLVRVGRPQARRLAAEQLDDGVRPAPAGVDVRRGERPVLPEPVPLVAARPQLVERRRARRVRRHPALLVRPRRRRLPHRRVPLDHQGPRAARQPARDQGRPLVRAADGPAQRLQRVPARGARRAAALAQAGRELRPAPRAHRRDVRARTRGSSRSFYGDGRRAEPRVQLHARCTRSSTRAELRDAVEHAEQHLPAARVAGVDGRQPRQPPLPDALGRGRSRSRTRRDA